MKTLSGKSPSIFNFKAIPGRKVLRVSFMTCSVFKILLFLYFPQSTTAQIRPKPQLQVISAKQENIITREFNLSGSDREVIELTLTKTGVIEAKAEWSGTAKELALILNGPGRTQYYERKDGKSPMVLRYKVSGNILSLGKTWKISVVNFRSGTTAQGRVQINYLETSESDQTEKPQEALETKPVLKPVTEPVIKPVAEEKKSIRIKHYEVQESKGFTAQQLQEIKAELEAQKIERTKAKIENRIKEIGPDNPLVQIVVPLMYKSFEEKIQKPLVKNGINTSPHLKSLIQSYKKLSPSITKKYFHPRYANLRTGQKIDNLQLGKDVLEAIRPDYKTEIRRMVHNSISADAPKFQWNAAMAQKTAPRKFEHIQVMPSQDRIKQLEILTNRLEANPTQDNINVLKDYVKAQGVSLAEPLDNKIQAAIAEEIHVPDLKWLPDLNNDHFVRNYYKYDIGLDWFYCVDQNERTCITIPFYGTVCSDDEPYWHISSTVPNYDPDDPDQLHKLQEGKIYSVFSRVTDTYDDVNNRETRTFRSQDRWLLNNNIYNTNTTFTIGLWEEDWTKGEVRDAIQTAINDLRDELIKTIKAAVMDAIKAALYESLMEALPDELKGVLQFFFEGKISFSSFMESVQTVMGGIDVGMIALQLIFSGESITEIISGLGGACPEITVALLAIKVVGPIVIDLFEGDFQDAFEGLLTMPLALFEYIFDFLTDIVSFFENLMAICDPDDNIQNRSITIEASFDNIFQDAPWGDNYSGITALTPSGRGPGSGNSSIIKGGKYLQPYLIFKGADAEYRTYYNVLRTIVGGRETFGFTTGADVANTFIQTRTYKSKSHSNNQKIKVSYCTLNNNGSPLIILTEKNGRASGTNLGMSEPEFYVNSIPGGEYELRIISLFRKDFYGYVTLEEEW